MLTWVGRGLEFWLAWLLTGVIGFQLADLGKPSVQGVVGEGYTRMLRGESNTLPDDGTFYGNPEDYLLPHYFPRDAPASHLLLLPARKSYRRLIEVPETAVDGFAAAAAKLDVNALPEAGAGGFGNEDAWLHA